MAPLLFVGCTASEVPRDSGARVLDSGEPDAGGGDTGVPLAPRVVPEPVRLTYPSSGFRTPPRREDRGGISTTARLSWEPSEGADWYEVELAFECPGRRTTCEVSESPRVVRVDGATSLSESVALSGGVLGWARVQWTARACNDLGCSPAAAARYFDAGRPRTDVNGDGFADLVVSVAPSDQTVAECGHLYLGGAEGLTSSPVVLSCPAGMRVALELHALGDVNGDGFDDLAAFAMGAEASEHGWFLYYGAELDQSPGPEIELGTRNPYGPLRAGDLDADGVDDLIALRATRWWSGSTEGPLPLQPLDPPVEWSRGQWAGDLDGDGLPDLITLADGGLAYRSLVPPAADWTIREFVSTQGPHARPSRGPSLFDLLIDDYTGDGLPDLVTLGPVPHLWSGTDLGRSIPIAMDEALGGGRLTGARALVALTSADGSPARVAVAREDVPGTLDILVFAYASERSPSVTHTVSRSDSASGFSISEGLDFDADGWADIALIIRSSSGSERLYVARGTARGLADLGAVRDFPSEIYFLPHISRVNPF